MVNITLSYWLETWNGAGTTKSLHFLVQGQQNLYSSYTKFYGHYTNSTNKREGNDKIILFPGSLLVNPFSLRPLLRLFLLHCCVVVKTLILRREVLPLTPSFLLLLQPHPQGDRWFPTLWLLVLADFYFLLFLLFMFDFLVVRTFWVIFIMW